MRKNGPGGDLHKEGEACAKFCGWRKTGLTRNRSEIRMAQAERVKERIVKNA